MKWRVDILNLQRAQGWKRLQKTSWKNIHHHHYIVLLVLCWEWPHQKTPGEHFSTCSHRSHLAKLETERVLVFSLAWGSCPEKTSQSTDSCQGKELWLSHPETLTPSAWVLTSQWNPGSISLRNFFLIHREFSPSLIKSTAEFLRAVNDQGASWKRQGLVMLCFISWWSCLKCNEWGRGGHAEQRSYLPRGS